jgi:NIMA (never in mitosis gene a)-related kinase 1/4/5
MLKSDKNVCLADFEIQGKLGSGSFGIVYKIKYKEDGKIYVLKQVNTAKMSYQEKKEAQKETMIHKTLDNQYIVKYVDHFLESKKINIILEYCDGGDLGKYLKSQMGKNIKEHKIWNFFIQACLGLQYLHTRKILHRDIKTINLFLTKDEFVKIGDLGVAKTMKGMNFAHTLVGTPYYLSPEL